MVDDRSSITIRIFFKLIRIKRKKICPSLNRGPEIVLCWEIIPVWTSVADLQTREEKIKTSDFFLLIDEAGRTYSTLNIVACSSVPTTSAQSFTREQALSLPNLRTHPQRHTHTRLTHSDTYYNIPDRNKHTLSIANTVRSVILASALKKNI